LVFDTRVVIEDTYIVLDESPDPLMEKENYFRKK